MIQRLMQLHFLFCFFLFVCLVGLFGFFFFGLLFVFIIIIIKDLLILTSIQHAETVLFFKGVWDRKYSVF
jgi:hypothetical protein